MAKSTRNKGLVADSTRMHLVAFDEEDIEIISAHLQDAITRVGDITFIPAARRFALVASRFDWAAAVDGALRRRLSGLHFDYVRGVRRSGFDQGDGESVLNLLSIAFDAGDAPSGQVTLYFSAGAAIRLDVECIDAQLHDLGPEWRTRARPEHDLPDTDTPSSEGAGDAN